MDPQDTPAPIAEAPEPPEDAEDLFWRRYEGDQA